MIACFRIELNHGATLLSRGSVSFIQHTMGRRSSAKWIVIEDLTERRRAQNRLAQRKKRE